MGKPESMEWRLVDECSCFPSSRWGIVRGILGASQEVPGDLHSSNLDNIPYVDPIHLLTWFSLCFSTPVFSDLLGLPWWLRSKESACNAGDLGSIPGSGTSPGEGNDYPLQYSCLENPMDGGAWQAIAHMVSELTWLKWLRDQGAENELLCQDRGQSVCSLSGTPTAAWLFLRGVIWELGDLKWTHNSF